MIDYYSAARPRNTWTRARDASLFVTLVMALPVTWLCDVMVARPTVAAEFSGILSQNEGGVITAELQDVGNRSGTHAPKPLHVPIGVFRMELIDQRHGWPLTTTVRRLPARVDLDLRIEPAPRPNASLAADDPIRAAITQSLTSSGRHEMLRAWPAPDAMPSSRAGVEVRRSWLGWITSIGVWWIVLVFLCGALIQILKFMSALVFAKRHARRASLRAQGKCHTCGYDLTGLEFNERCPECGQLVW